MTGVWPLALAVAVVGGVVLLVRYRRLEERHALVWLAAAALTATVVLVRPVRTGLADLVGVGEATVVGAMACAAVVALLLEAYAVIARLSSHSRTLAQRVALLEERLARSERAADEVPAIPGGDE